MLHSIIYRIILLVFSIYIVQNYCGKISIEYIYWIALLYLVLIMFFKLKDKGIPRLLTDFFFMNLVVWGRNINEPMVFLFILLPIINAINFTGKNSHSIILLMLMTLTFLLHMRPFETWIIIPITTLWVIYINSWSQLREWKVINEISKEIDNFFVNQQEIQKSHKIYEHIIDELNKFFFLETNKGITLIRAYILKGDTLWLIRSSKFLWKRNLTINKEDYQRLRETNVIKKIVDDNIELYTYIQQGNLEYVFICDIEDSALLSIFRPRVKYLLLKTFSKVALLHNFEYKIMKMRNQKFDEIKDNVIYVNKAVRIMHFIRNRMTPITNIIAFHKTYNKISEEKQEKMTKYLQKLVVQADNDLKEILTTADYLLDKSNNPLIDSKLKEVHISKMYIFVAEIVEQLLEGTVEPEISLQEQLESKYFVKTNIIETKILITDWVNNMRKYMDNYYVISVSFQNGFLTMNFRNDYQNKEESITQLVKDMNSTSKDAVLEGKNYGHGIYTIKSIAEKLHINMNSFIEYDVSLKKNILNFNLSFETFEHYEDTNI